MALPCWEIPDCCGRRVRPPFKTADRRGLPLHGSYRGSKNLHVREAGSAVCSFMEQRRSFFAAALVALLLLSCASSPSEPTPPSKVAFISAAITSTTVDNDASTVTYTVTYTGGHQFFRVYVDTDRSAGSGFQYSGVGAEFLIENSNLYQYTGSGTDWSWANAGAVTFSNAGGRATWIVSRSALGETDPCTSAANLVFADRRRHRPDGAGNPDAGHVLREHQHTGFGHSQRTSATGTRPTTQPTSSTLSRSRVRPAIGASTSTRTTMHQQDSRRAVEWARTTWSRGATSTVTQALVGAGRPWVPRPSRPAAAPRLGRSRARPSVRSPPAVRPPLCCSRSRTAPAT